MPIPTPKHNRIECELKNFFKKNFQYDSKRAWRNKSLLLAMKKKKKKKEKKSMLANLPMSTLVHFSFEAKSFNFFNHV